MSADAARQLMPTIGAILPVLQHCSGYQVIIHLAASCRSIGGSTQLETIRNQAKSRYFTSKRPVRTKPQATLKPQNFGCPRKWSK
jgi:hypothetical protein